MPTLPPEVTRRYGEGLLGDALPKGETWLVVTMPEPWEIARSQFPQTPLLHFVATMAEEEVERVTDSLPPLDGVLGLGGGSCMDFAKYVAWKQNAPCLLAPSIVSVDACLTDAIAVRRDGRVHYLGQVYPQEVLVDFDVICKAPPELNRAGAGDILSIHTALSDWKRAHDDNGEAYSEEIATASRALLETLSNRAEDIRNATPLGVQTLVELFNAEVRLCYQMGNSRPEEGSEHFWAYNLEFRTGRSFVHGDLIALGILLMSGLQENDVKGVKERIQALGLKHTPEDLHLSHETVCESLLTARDYAIEDQLAYSVLHARPIDTSLANHLIAGTYT
jgi:glycerol-1-phosphate dehydrogenase [NAD(P)+]